MVVSDARRDRPALRSDSRRVRARRSSSRADSVARRVERRNGSVDEGAVRYECGDNIAVVRGSADGGSIADVNVVGSEGGDWSMGVGEVKRGDGLWEGVTDFRYHITLYSQSIFRTPSLILVRHAYHDWDSTRHIAAHLVCRPTFLPHLPNSKSTNLLAHTPIFIHISYPASSPFLWHRQKHTYLSLTSSLCILKKSFNSFSCSILARLRSSIAAQSNDMVSRWGLSYLCLLFVVSDDDN